MFDNGGGFLEFLVGIFIFVLDVWAIIDIWGHTRAMSAKVIWTLVVLFFPVVGLIIYALFGRGRLASTH